MILAFNVSSYLVQSRVRNLTDQARFLAQTVQLEVQRATTAEALAETLERRQSSTETRYPFVSIAVVPVADLDVQGRAGTGGARAEERCRSPLPVVAGRWGHLPPPTALPKWVGCDGFSGLIAYNAPASAEHGRSAARKRGW